MAHFAELDGNNIVTRVVVVGNDVTTAAGPLGSNDMHVDGETWCINFFKGGNWKQTSYNNNFRKQYAGKGYTFDAAKNKFISPQPYDSWALDGNDDWQAPVTYPTDTDDGADPMVWRYIISWSETKYQADNTTGWEAIKSNDESETPTKYDWNGSSWVSE
jgi:hypothetical protein